MTFADRFIEWTRRPLPSPWTALTLWILIIVAAVYVALEIVDGLPK